VVAHAWGHRLYCGGAFPVLYLSYLGIRYMRSTTTMEEPKDVLFTEVVIPSQVGQEQILQKQER